MNALYVVLLLSSIVAINALPLISGGLGAGNIPGSGLGGLGSPLVAAQGGHVAAAYGASGNFPNTRVAPSGIVIPAGHGLEGQYIYDFSERRFDDGTYKPHVYGA